MTKSRDGAESCFGILRGLSTACVPVMNVPLSAPARRCGGLMAMGLIAIMLSACGGSGDGGRGGGPLLDSANPSGTSLPPVLEVTGPASGSPGVEAIGFRVSVTRGGRTAAQDLGITLSATNGMVSIVERGITRPGLASGFTDAFGRLEFTFTPDADLTADATGVIVAEVTDRRFANGSCIDNANAVCEGSVAFTIRADQFRFTAPTFGTAVNVGRPNAQALQFQWRTADGRPVINPQGGGACVDLSTRFSGAGTSQFGLIIAGDPTPQSQRRRVLLNSNGSFAQSVTIFSDRSGFLEVEARENRSCGPTASGELLASTGVQFLDEPCEQTSDGRDCVDLRAPLVLMTGSGESANQPSADLTMEVRNAAFQPVDNIQVLFRILSAASGGGSRPNDPNERVFPGGGTTDASGIARSTYFAPIVSTEAVVDIEACVRALGSGDIDGRFCRTRRITLRPPPPPPPAPTPLPPAP